MLCCYLFLGLLRIITSSKNHIYLQTPKNPISNFKFSVQKQVSKCFNFFYFLFLLSWEEATLLMTDVNFFQQLIFYNKDEIPEDKFRALKKFVSSPDFDPHIVHSSSIAAACICKWVHAVYQYSSIHRKMQPHIKNLLDAENKFTKVRGGADEMLSILKGEM